MEYQRRVLACHILRMNRRKAKRAAFYYFNNSKAELAGRLASTLIENPQTARDFIKRFPISPGDQIKINKVLLRQSLPTSNLMEWIAKVQRDGSAEKSIIK